MNSEKILNLILSEVYNAPTQNDFLHIQEVKDNKGVLAAYTLSVGGVPLPVNRLTEIIEAANQLDNNVLFQYIINELEYHGSKRMAVQADDWDAVRFPKAFIYAADLLRNKVKKLKNLTIEPKKVEAHKPKK